MGTLRERLEKFDRLMEIGDEERRVVADRIRKAGRVGYYSQIYRLVMGEDIPTDTSNRQDEESLADRLADLIEPDTERSYDEGYDEGYRAGMQAVRARMCRNDLLALADSMEDANVRGSVCDRCMRRTSEKIKAACGCGPEARMWKVTGAGLPLLLVRGTFEEALARAREVDPGYCGMQRWDDRFDGSVPDGVEILE